MLDTWVGVLSCVEILYVLYNCVLDILPENFKRVKDEYIVICFQNGKNC